MNSAIIAVKQGQLQGITDQNLDGQEFLKFLGIPYAQPPIGKLRFKAPQPPECWNGVRDCSKEGDACYTTDYFTQQIIGSEDCLYLNVFTKQLPQTGVSRNPVLVFIHGGAFTMGSSTQKHHGAKYLLTQDIVLVTINYRLGMLGFLSLEDTSLEVPGNAGLKDQTFALKWVKDNIAKFNGDPNNVTICGVSAGSASVQFHVISPLSTGLFHKAIMQSGSVLNPWAWGQRNAKQIAEGLGKTVATEKDALDILMKTSVEDLYQAQLKMSDNLLDSSNKRPFGPVIEYPNSTAFLTENPVSIFKSGKYNQVPMIQGLTSNEGLLYDFLIMLKNSTDVKPGPELGVLWNLGLKNDSDEYEKVRNLIEEFYFNDGGTKDSIYEFFADTLFLAGIIDSLKLSIKTSNKALYLYVFSADTDFSKGMKKLFIPSNYEQIKGVAHGTDQLYLMSSDLTMGIETSPENEKVVRQFVKLWTTFARTGNPTDGSSFIWEPVTDENDLKFLDIDVNPSMKINPFAERLEFWNKVFYENGSEDRLSTAKL